MVGLTLSFLFSSDVQKGETVVSLDQLDRIKERRETPENSPNGKNHYDELFKEFISKNQALTFNTNLTEITDKKTGGQSSEVDAGYASPVALSVCEEDDVTRACTPDSQRSKDIDSGCEDDGPKGTEDWFENELDMNPDHFAPFIPPPVGDSPFFPDCMDLGSLDQTLDDNDLIWSNESWEIVDTEADMRVVKDSDIKRNISTPKFYPSEEVLPVLNSNEVEMSTPISNLLLLEGNEIWFAFDQGRQVTV